MDAPSPDPQFYHNGAKKMISEGLEVISKIMAFIRTNRAHLAELSPKDRKKKILDFEPSKSFNSIHPIVFHYIAVEGVFNHKAFKRYILHIYGKPKSQEELAQMRSNNRKAMYYRQNEKNALYYKYLLMETNPNVDNTTIHKMYEDMVKELNADIDNLLDKYEEAEKETKLKEAQYSQEKRQEIIKIMKRQV